MRPKLDRFKPGAQVRVYVQSLPPVEGTVTGICERGFYMDAPRALFSCGMEETAPPHERFFGWGLFQSATLLKEAP
jgi:hypothetical protein